MIPSVQLLQAAGGVAPDILQYLSIVPDGYASQAATRTITSSTFRMSVKFRRSTLATSDPLLGNTTTSNYALRVNSDGDRIDLAGSTDMYSIPISVSLLVDTWYTVIAERVGSDINITVLDIDGDVYAAGTNAGTLNQTYSFRWLASTNATAFYPYDVSRIEIGTTAAPLEHVWVPQSSGTVWTDTGTVGGWDWTLTGSPLPTWEP